MRAVASPRTAKWRFALLLLLLTIVQLPRCTVALMLDIERGQFPGVDTNVLFHCKEDDSHHIPPVELPDCRGKLFRWFKDGFEIFPSPLRQKKALPHACRNAEYQKHLVVLTTTTAFDTDVCISQLLIRQVTRKDSGNYECVKTGLNGTVRSNTVRLHVDESIVLDAEVEVQVTEEHNNPSHLKDVCDTVNNEPIANIENLDTYLKRAFTTFKLTTRDSRLFDSNNESLARELVLNIWDTVTLHKFNENLASYTASYPETVLRFESKLAYFCNYAEIYVHALLNTPTRLSIVLNRFMYRWPSNTSCSITTQRQQMTTVAPFNSSSFSVILYVALGCFAATLVVALFVLLSVRKMNRHMLQMRYAAGAKTKSETSSPSSAQTHQSNPEYTRSVDMEIPLLGVQSGSVSV